LEQWNVLFKRSLVGRIEGLHPEVYEKSKLVWENANGNLDLALSLYSFISIDYAVMERSKENKSGILTI
jgi:mannose-1-phosphate guanylyltransferase